MHLPGAQVPKPMHLTTKLCTHRVQGAPSISDTILPLGTEPIDCVPYPFPWLVAIATLRQTNH